MTALLDHLWQSTVFTAMIGAFTLLLRNNRAGVRYALWLMASLKFLLPFSWLVAIGSSLSGFFSSPLNTPTVLEIVAQPFAASSPAFPDITQLLIVSWGLGFASIVSVWLSRWLKLRLVVRDAVTLSLAAPMPVKSTTALLEPGLVGIWRPVLLLPKGIAERLSAGEMQAILAHEHCHLRRQDNLTASFHMLVEALFWFYPLVWWLGARLIAEREQSCDEAVLEAGNAPKTYVEGIMKVCRFYLHSPLDCAAGVSGADLNTRMEKIMENRLTARLSTAKIAILVAGVGFAIALPLMLGLFNSPPSNTTTYDEANSCGAENLRPVTGTHGIPRYPSAAAKAREEGTTMLRVIVGKDGSPVSLRSVGSSGFADLDDAGVQYVKGNWRWKPLRSGCSSATTNVNIVWRLKPQSNGTQALPR